MKMPWTTRGRVELRHDFQSSGVSFSMPGHPNGWWNSPGTVGPDSVPIAAYLGQLVNEGVATPSEQSVFLAWSAYFDLVRDDAHAQSLHLLGMPGREGWVPVLETRGTPTESGFAVGVVGWQSPTRGRHTLQRRGAVLVDGNQCSLLLESAWRLCESVSDLMSRSQALTGEQRMHALGHIQALAVDSDAVLDDYLQKTKIVSPGRLHLDLLRHQSLGAPVVEVAPRLDGVSDKFVDTFDRYDSVRKRYDVTQPDGSLLHVTPSPAVVAALSALKAMPGRRVASEQARIFVHNPFAVLGEDAREALDEDALIQARQDAGLLPYQLRFVVAGEGEVEPQLELIPLAEAEEPIFRPVSHASAKAVLAKSAHSRAHGWPLFHWDGYEIELGAVTDSALAQLAGWLAASVTASLSYAEVMNLDAFSDRVIGFDAKVQVVPYVAQRTEGAGWVPENAEFGLVCVDRATGTVEHRPQSSADLQELQDRVVRARADGATEVTLPNSSMTVPLERAQQLLESLESAEISIGKKQTPVLKSDPTSRGGRPGLQIFHNIENLDYVVGAVAEFEESSDKSPTLPNALRPEVKLLGHQVEGLAWLQHRYGLQPDGVSGCLLADDMGLGKTLQSLCLIAWQQEHEEKPKPCLIVAPVSLLENWKLEIAKFLGWAHDTVLSLYGLELGRLRLGGSAIDPELTAAGIRKLLRPGFEEGYKVVLTTYETLRDYELSLARVPWGVVVCDEAQKIKNPAAFVTQAAKALKAEFRVACTGTPVENSLADLWCLFDFFQPGYLGSLNEFTRKFRRSIETRAEGHGELVERLRTATRPWVLRRMKTEVHQGLPAKIEGMQADPASVALPMSAKQSRLYADAVEEYRAGRESPGAGKGTQILALLAKLRMICANPLAVENGQHEVLPIDEHLASSPKLRWLLGRLVEIRGQAEKAIVFTEFRDLQRLIQRVVAERLGYSAQIINGSTTVDARSEASRQALIDGFQAEPGFGVIILSTTAVGFGVNIQAANHVIHYTRPWNPAKEDQATDRAYRIGQTRDVHVYCPTVVGGGFESFEERLSTLLASKRDLSRDMLAGTQEVTAEDFVDL